MKKLLTSLLAVAMLLTIGATSVFADENGSTDFGGVAPTDQAWSDEGNTQDIALEVQLTDNKEAGFTGDAQAAAYADHKYRVVVAWKKTAGTGTVNYSYFWDTMSKKYVASSTKTATVTTNPTLGVSITNYSNDAINYQINLKGDHKFQSPLGELGIPSWAKMDSPFTLGSAAVDGEGNNLTSLETIGNPKTVEYGSYVSEAPEDTTFYVEAGSLTKDSVKQTVGTVTVTISKVTER